jgi:hypothetical protein
MTLKGKIPIVKCRLKKHSGQWGNRDNYKEWFNAAWPAFLSLHGEDFEKRGVFKHYKQGTPGQKRDAIKKKIRQAFKSLAPQIG